MGDVGGSWNLGYHFGGPDNKDYNINRVYIYIYIYIYPYFGKLPGKYLDHLIRGKGAIAVCPEEHAFHALKDTSLLSSQLFLEVLLKHSV